MDKKSPAAKHLLTGEELSNTDILQLIAKAKILKSQRQHKTVFKPLAGMHLALLFSKPSLRTR